MATIPYSTFKTRFKTLLRDTSDITWSDGEKDECLEEALNDPNAFRIVRDQSLTTISNQYIYSIPATMNGLMKIELILPSATYPIPVDRSNWSLVDGQFIFDGQWYSGVPIGSTIVLTGRTPVYTPGTDVTLTTIPDYMVEYAMACGKVHAFNMLRTKLTTGFLKNEMTMTDIINSLRESKAERDLLRHGLLNKATQAM